MSKCSCYHEYVNPYKAVCYGTKEMDACSCGGDEAKCSFYPEKRAAALQKKTMKFRIVKYYDRYATEVLNQDKNIWESIGSPNGYASVKEAKEYCARYKHEKKSRVVEEFEL